MDTTRKEMRAEEKVKNLTDTDYSRFCCSFLPNQPPKLRHQRKSKNKMIDSFFAYDSIEDND
jgi:hypothetical protein